TRVLANQYFGTPARSSLRTKNATCRITQTQCKFCIDYRPTDFTTDTISSEIFTLAHTETPLLLTASHTLSASQVCATSCTLRIPAPRSTPANAAARLPARRSLASRPVTAPIIDLRDKPSNTGR